MAWLVLFPVFGGLLVVGFVSGLVIWGANAYLLVMVGAGWWQMRRAGVRLGEQALLRYEYPHAGRRDDMLVFFLVPCLNEARVIGGTVARLATGQRAHVIVIDDGSDDGTAAEALAAGRAVAGGDQVTVVRRELPRARQGKGAALNAGLEAARAEVARAGLDAERVLVCVMDADGRLSDGAVGYVTGMFAADPGLGGVQLAVRIRNRSGMLTWVQDYLFWALAAVTQFGREGTGTVSLGGNGQFTRLAAMPVQPWRQSLTEDLDLTITMATMGWKLATTPHAAVSQQGVETVRQLIRQRSRWYQGHMYCGRRLGEIWRARELPHAAALELTAYLVVPWVFDLPWSVLWQLAVIHGGFAVWSFVGHATSVVTVAGGLSGLYMFMCFPALLGTVLQKRRAPECSWGRAFLLGHSFFVMNYVFFYCAWKALWRLVIGRDAWDKTSRHEELPAARQVAALAAAAAENGTLFPGSPPKPGTCTRESGMSSRLGEPEMYILPVTGLNILGGGLIGTACITAGYVLLRMARMQRRRQLAGRTGKP